MRVRMKVLGALASLAMLWLVSCDLRGKNLGPDGNVVTATPTPPPPAGILPGSNPPPVPVNPPIQSSFVPKINPIYGSATVSTFAGSAGQVGTGGGVGAAARFASPMGMGTDGAVLVVADSGTHILRQIVIATATVSTIAGSPGVIGNTYLPAGPSTLHKPMDAAFVGAPINQWFFSEVQNRQISIWQPLFDKVVAAGLGYPGYVDGLGGPPGTGQAMFYSPLGLVAWGTSLYIADATNRVIRELDTSTGMVTTLAGTPGRDGFRDGAGNQALFMGPTALATDGTSLFVGEMQGYRIRRVDLTTGFVSTLAGNGKMGHFDGQGLEAEFDYVADMTFNAGFLYICGWGNNAIRRINTTTGDVTTVAGRRDVQGYLDGAGSQAQLNNPGGIAIAGGVMYVSDTQNFVIRSITGF